MGKAAGAIDIPIVLCQDIAAKAHEPHCSQKR